MVGLTDQIIAAAQAGGQPDPMAGCAQTLAFLGIIVAIFYFMVIRPQRKQQAAHQQFIDRLKVGDRVIMASGILGKITQLDDDIVTLDVGDRTRIKFLRSQVSRSQDAGGSSDDGDSRGSLQGDSPNVSRSKKKR